MKIHMIHDILIEGKRGQNAETTHTIELYENLKKIGNEVCLFVRKSRDANPYISPNIFYFPILNISIMRSMSSKLALFLYYSLYRIKYIKPDIIYSRTGILMIILSKLFRTPYIVEINGGGINEMKSINISMFRIQIHKMCEKFNLKYADKIVAVSQELKEELKNLHNIPDEKIVVIENGANTDLFKPINKDFKEKLNLDPNYHYVGFSGNFAPYHGLDDLVKSAPCILKEVENTKFLLIGKGGVKEQIIKMVNDLNLTDNFIFINRIPYEEVPKYVNAFDVCVILKKKDIPGSPLKLWEYMACGKPVVATNTQDFKVLEECNAGILVDPEKPEEVADAIITLLKNKELREEMGKNGREYVVENRSWEAVAREVEKVMKEAVK